MLRIAMIRTKKNGEEENLIKEGEEKEISLYKWVVFY